MDRPAGALLRFIGRVTTDDPTRARFSWSGTGFEARFVGTGLRARLENADGFWFKPVVDGTPTRAFAARAGSFDYELAGGLAHGVHSVALHRQTEGVFGESALLGIEAIEGELLDAGVPRAPAIEVYGASVSTGYGNLGSSGTGFEFATQSHWDSYAAVAARRLGAELSVVAVSGRGVHRNFDGTSAGTLPSLYDRVLAGRAEPRWDFRRAPEAVVINLGKNDFGSGDPGRSFVDAYAAFLRRLRGHYPRAWMVCSTGPNLGAELHARQVAHVQSALHELEAVGEQRLALLDWPEQTERESGADFHPNAEKHHQMGVALARRLEQLDWTRGSLAG